MNINKLGDKSFSEEIVNLQRIGNHQGLSQIRKVLSSRDTVSTSVVSDVLSKASLGVRTGSTPRLDLIERFKANVDQPVTLSDNEAEKIFKGIVA